MSISIEQVEHNGVLDAPGVQRQLRKLAGVFPLAGNLLRNKAVGTDQIDDGAVTETQLDTAVLDAFLKLAVPGDHEVAFGSVSMNFGATVGARVTGIAHGLSTTPLAVFTNLVVSDGGTGAARFVSNSSDYAATTFAINGRRIDGSTGGVLNCVWLAVV